VSDGTTPLLIFPCNGNGMEALDALGGLHQFLGFVDDTAQKQGAGCHGFPVFPRKMLRGRPDAQVLAVPGSPESFRQRRDIIDALHVEGHRWAQVVHPSASISPRASIGRNVLIMAGVVISGNAVIGDHVCILPNTVIHHDSHVGDWSLIGSNVTVAGGVVVGPNCYIGSGTSIKNGVTIGAGSLVGLATTVIDDVLPGRTVAGNPARYLVPRHQR
jgi:sugar O-acyltransferase (sialic acid O-acetyltransferase NeuD family)